MHYVSYDRAGLYYCLKYTSKYLLTMLLYWKIVFYMTQLILQKMAGLLFWKNMELYELPNFVDLIFMV